MTARNPKPKLRLRFVAAFCLLVWVGALTICTFDCAGVQKTHNCCHKNPTSENKSTCLHTKPVTVLHAPTQLFKPQLALVIFPIAPTDGQISQAAFYSEFSRQAAGRNLLSTPEVCLGPAFRSLAPPVLL
jgi:hypothetical protein